MKIIDSTLMRVRDAWSNRNEPEHLRILLESYWRALLGMAGILIACAILYSAFNLFSVLSRGKNVPALSPDEGLVVFDNQGLETTLDGFVTRETNYEFLKKNPPKIFDPSR
ncbi:MAG: hypothetical protein AAB798_02675 [Patescibacteria group bacterium]